jgi:outer membrane protein OmpA-like peptidoglycan-associated protein
MSATKFSTGSHQLIRGAVLLITAFAITSCAWSNKVKGGAIGAAGGAAVGGVVGNQTGSTARGAIIGAVVGGAAGAIIGHQMDQQTKELAIAIPGARVERVGEGMVVTFASGLLYDYDSDAIRPEAALNLQALATSLKKYSGTELLIVGHTDAVGSLEYNQALSTRRADSASRYLVSEGVGSARMRTSGRGELEAVGSNETEAGRQQNRRIEVAIYASEAVRTASR